MSRTARLFQLMQALRSLPSPVTAERLADETNVSIRTMYRDIESLRGLGAVIDGEAGFGYTLIEDATLPPLGFEDEELEALVLGLREVMQVGDPSLAKGAESDLAKLGARLPEGQSRRLKHAVLTAKSYNPPPTPKVDAGVLRRAAWDEKRIRFSYSDVEGAKTSREVYPLSIVFMQSSHCLVGWCHLRNDFRVFRVDLIEAATPLPELFVDEPGHSYADYLRQMTAQQP